MEFALGAGALIWSAVIAASIHPFQLAYFNELAGGPQNGWRCLVDSNIDWGQDLPALHDLVARLGLGRIQFSYFGSAHPSYYGIDFEPLPTSDLSPERGNPLTRTFFPTNPAPGIYAISVTNLRGVGLPRGQWDLYAWFRDRQPFARAGYSIFLYRVEPQGPPADVALADLQVDELGAGDYAGFHTNDVRLRWFDAGSSLILSRQPGWYAVVGNEMEAWGWKTYRPCAAAEGCRLYPPDAQAHAAVLQSVEAMQANSAAWVDPSPAPASGQASAPLRLPANLGDRVEFLGYKLSPLPSGNWSLETAWKVTAPPGQDLAMFVHWLGADGKPRAQWDGLDVPVEGWREGDIWIQRVSLALGAPPSGPQWIQVGLYNPQTMRRLPVLESGAVRAERVLLGPVYSSDDLAP